MLKGFLDLMEEKGWVVRLKPGAVTLHEGMLEAATTVKKDQIEDLNDSSKIVKREGKVGQGLLNGRPFLKEAIKVS